MRPAFWILGLLACIAIGVAGAHAIGMNTGLSTWEVRFVLGALGIAGLVVAVRSSA